MRRTRRCSATRRRGPAISIASQPWARYWPAWTSVVFLRSYRATVGAAPFAPSTIESFEAGLRLFLAEQALRDLENELRYRPEWLSVPLRMLIFVLTPPAA